MSSIDPLKFPHLEPISKAPPLFRVNGCGVGVYGRRDFDAATATYVKTWCVALLFVPVFCLRAYRVADGEPRGWVFLGREPLSGLAKSWNMAVAVAVAAALALASYSGYTSSPEYRARRTMAEAERLVDGDARLRAATLYAEVVDSQTAPAPAAEERLAALLGEATAAERPAELAVLANAVLRLRNEEAKGRLTAGLLADGLAVVDARGEEEPRAALALLDAIAPLAPEGEDTTARREPLLEALVVREPEDPDAASQLAVILEGRGELSRCETILAPHAARLGDREGARILGQIRAAAGELDASRALLVPYTTGRLERLARASKAYEAASQAVWDREIANLNANAAPQSWYRDYDHADAEGQARMVQEWVGPRLRQSPEVAAAEEALRRETTIVPVALDLGIVMVERAAALPAAERRAELEAAEKVFLGIRGFAEETDEYRLSLGQVYYWLDRPDDGRHLFDELLAAHQRSPEMLLGVGVALRAVGAASEARTLAEEAYAAAGSEELRRRAATFRALLAIDAPDQVRWYERADTTNPEVRASLYGARAALLATEGRRREAAEQARRALEVYATMQETSTSLNNAALVHFRLFEVTGDRREFQEGARKMRRTVELVPSDTAVLTNAAYTLTRAAVLDVVGDAIDFAALQAGVDTELLGYLYDDEAGRRRVRRRFVNNRSAVEARSYLEKLLVLAPKRADSYSALLPLLDGADDEAERLRALVDRLDGRPLDLEDSMQETRRWYSGEEDERRRASLEAYVEHQRPIVAATARRGGVTFAVAASGLCAALVQAHDLGGTVDPDDVVRLCEQAYAAAPSVATRGALQTALLFRAGEALAERSTAWAELLARCRRTLGTTYLVPLVLSAGTSFAERLAADADVRRAVELAAEESARRPSSPSLWDWALLSRTKPALADEVVRTLRGAELTALRQQVNERVAPLSTRFACRGYWLRLVRGRPGEARAVLDGLAKLGVPQPLEVVADAPPSAAPAG